MIFRPELARKIIRGEKTMTRRPIKPGEKHCRYQEGRDYAVQPGSGKPESCRILITAVEGQALGDLTYRDARAEGFKTRDDFKMAWTEIHGRYDPAMPVWAIRFRLHADQPRLLMPIGAGHHDPQANPGIDMPADHGYTSDHNRSVRDEPEAVDERTQDRFAAQARERERVSRSETWMEARGILTAQLDRLKAAGPGRHAAREIRAIEARIRRLDDRYAA